ncbi:MAG: SDR family oxidoreductase [Chitinophagia bacterium]|jgi:L-fucose dehydrogenase
MDLFLKDKVIIVTGGARGIGKAIVFALSREGAVPVIVSRDELENQELVNELAAAGSIAYQVAIELREVNQIKQVIENIVQKFGRIDGLVNNAGYNDGVGLEKGNYEAFMRSLHDNLVHYYLMAKHCLPWLIQSTNAAIVNIVSKTAETGQGNTSAYAASNGGRAALTREWAVELLKYGIRVNGVVVAECYTPAYETWIATLPDPANKIKEINQRIPLENRMTTPAEIASAVVFFLSPVSSHTTGQLLHVDGGYVHLDRALANA